MDLRWCYGGGGLDSLYLQSDLPPGFKGTLFTCNTIAHECLILFNHHIMLSIKSDSRNFKA